MWLVACALDVLQFRALRHKPWASSFALDMAGAGGASASAAGLAQGLLFLSFPFLVIGKFRKPVAVVSSRFIEPGGKDGLRLLPQV